MQNNECMCWNVKDKTWVTANVRWWICFCVSVTTAQLLNESMKEQRDNWGTVKLKKAQIKKSDRKIVIWIAQALVRCHSRLNINWSIKFWFFIIVVGISFFFFKSVSRTRSSQDTSPTSTCHAATCTKLRNRAVLPSFFTIYLFTPKGHRKMKIKTKTYSIIGVGISDDKLT